MANTIYGFDHGILIDRDTGLITIPGDLAVDGQDPNTVLAGPSSGSAIGTATFRSLVPADIPNKPVATETGTYTVTTADHLIRFTATATCNLPPATGSGQPLIVAADGAGVVVTVDGNGSETINNELTQVLTDGDAIDLYDVAVGKWIIG
jgi:hypothetical protein